MERDLIFLQFCWFLEKRETGINAEMYRERERFIDKDRGERLAERKRKRLGERGERGDGERLVG